ncbi:hypothetical protein HRbin32_00948 [bacterium HR32]|nr:hypothetical protein HRbin32_00948 [bacterium HR32]
MPGGRVASHIEGAQGWLARAAHDWRRGERGRTLAHLSLAEAEVRLALRLAEAEPLPNRWRRSRTVAVVAAALAAATVLGAGVRWPGGSVEDRVPSQAAAATVSLGYVPGALLGLVAPARETLTARPWAAPAVHDETVWLHRLFEDVGAPTPGPALWPEDALPPP